MKNLINYLSKKSLSLGNGSGMTRFSLASLICLCMLTIGVGQMWGTDPAVDDVIFEENFGDWGANQTDFSKCTALSDYNKRGTVCWVAADKSGVSFSTDGNAKGTTSTGGNCTSGHIWVVKKTTGYFTISGIPLYTSNGVKKVEVTWSQGGGSSMTCTYAFDGGNTWNSAGSTSSAGATVPSTPTEITVTGHSTIALKFTRTNTNTNIRIDNIKITVTEVAPTGTSVTLSKAATSNGSFTLSPASSVTTTSSAGVVTVSCSPADGYATSSVSATNPETNPSAITYGGSGNSRTVTYATGANGSSEISVTFACATPTFGMNLSTVEVDYDQNESATALTVAASANNGTINYQWQSSDNGSSGWANIVGATSASYTPPTDRIGHKYYQCIATNTTGGSCTATSNVAHIHTNAAAGYCISVFNSSDDDLYTGFSNGGSGNEYSLTGFTIPDKDGSSNWPQYWVGEDGEWSGTFSANANFADMKHVGSDNTVGLAAGATGTLYIWDDNKASGSNLWIRFKPSGYGLRWGGAGEWDQAANTKAFTVDPGDANVYWTELVTLDGINNTTWNYYVGLQTASGYVYSGVDNEASDSRGTSRTRSVTAMKVSNGTSGSYKATYLNSEATGTRGKFRMWADNDDDYNFYCHFVPFYQLQYNKNGGTGNMDPLPATPVCCEASSGSRTVTVATSSFTAPTHYQFDHWNTASDNSGSNVSTGSYTLTGDVTLYAQWAPVDYTITTTFTNVSLSSAFPASVTYTGTTTSALNNTLTVNTTNFFLPSSITVSMEGTGTLTQGTHYTYNSSTGAFTFDVAITGNIVITATAVPKLKSIAITTQPTTRAYLVGETFSKTGAVVTATMGDGTTKAVTASATWDLTTLSAGTSQTVTASYTEAGITKTATTTIDVYSVTVQKYDETPAEIVDAGVTVGANGRTLSQSVGSTKYVFNNWSLITASGMSISTNSLTGTPTGNVVVRGNFYKPVVITWLKGGVDYTTGGPTTEVARGTLWSALTPPTDPGDATLGACATKFMGWSNNPAAEWTKEEHHTAPATLVKAAGFSSISTAITSDITFRAVFATAGGGGGAAIGTTMWSEDFSSYSNPDEPSGSTNASNDNGRVVYNGGSVTYTCVAGNAATCVYENAMCGGESPELLINKHKSSPSADGAFTIGGIPVGGAATLTLTYKMNNTNISQATTSTANVSIGERTNPSGTTYVQTITISGNVSTFDLTFTNSSSSNGRIDDISVVVATQNVTYSDYVTVCCTQYDITLASSGSVTGGTFTASPTSACEDTEVTLSATPADGYSFAGWTVTKTASPYTDITSTNVDGNTLTMPDYGVTVNATFATLTGITVKTAPTKTTYCEGDNFDPTGLVITASFSNSTTLDIPYSGNEAKFTFSPTTVASLTTGNTSVTITYSGQSTSQAITINAKLTVTRAGTPAGTVTGGTFTVDNATACVGTTINIEAEAASHYTFGSWTITKTSDGTDVTASVSIGSATSASTSFTMPAYAVTVTATFNENAYHTATFKNNGVAVSGYDGVKTYDGERPSAPTLTDITDACDKTDCNKFYGWIAEAGIWPKTINSVAGKTIYRHAGDIPNVSGADVVYHAVWAKGTGDPEIPNTLIAKWDKQSIAASTAIKAKDKDGNTLNSVTMTSNISMTTSAVYGYANTSISTDPVITLAGLDFSDYNAGVITFFARGSQQALVTVEYSTDGGSSYSTDHFSDGTAKKELGYVVTVPNTTTNVKISYGSNTGNFYFGNVRAYGTTTTSYDFTELTSSNTSGWSGADWDGYYLIVGNSNTKAFRSDIMEGLYGMTTVSPSEAVISTSDLGLMFKAKYNSSTTGYAIRSAATQDYLTDNGGGVSEKYHLLETSATEAISIAYNQITHATGYYVQWATDRFGSYGSSTAPTLYKILETFSEFRITCCDKEITIGTPTKTGSGTVTFTSGGDDYAVGDNVETCEGATVITATVTPSNGYQCTALTFSRADGEDVVIDVDPATVLPFTAATDFELTFEENANTTLNTSVTFTALHDYYIDKMHYNSTFDKSGNYGTAPSLSSETKGSECTGLHYKFIGWIPESDMNMTTGVPTTTANMVVGGATGKYATGTNYYAVWAEEN